MSMVAVGGGTRAGGRVCSFGLEATHLSLPPTHPAGFRLNKGHGAAALAHRLTVPATAEGSALS